MGYISAAFLIPVVPRTKRETHPIPHALQTLHTPCKRSGYMGVEDADDETKMIKGSLT
jgi:hypothetical protein